MVNLAAHRTKLNAPHRTACNNAEMSSVAVIIPAYNREDYIREALDSVLGQTHSADEVIVVDDGSSDRTAEIAEAYPGVTVLRQKNGGASSARNHALSVATSDWVAFLDSDDVWRLDKLELQMAALAKNPGYDACTSNARALVGPDDPEDFGPPPLRLPPSDQIAPGLRGSLRVPPGTVVVKRELVRQVGGFDNDARPCEDWDLCLRLVAAKCRFLLVPEDLLFIRQHDSNISNQSYRMMDAELRAWDRHIGPDYPAAVRPLRRLQAKSHFLGRVALSEREQGRPHLGIMARSLLLWPAGDWARHKVFAHMLLRRANLLPAR
jgi:glycosyltransferase involved in cell wall biosynthesis